MKKHSEISPRGTSSLPLISLEDNPVIEWISKHGEKILYSILGAFSLLILFYLWQSGTSTRMEGDYQSAAHEFQSFQQAANSGKSKEMQDSFEKLTLIMTQLPDLHAKYDGAIAQTFIDFNDIKQAKPFALSTLQRVGKDQLAFYNEYAQITLLISEGQNGIAIERSLALKQNMIQNLEQKEKELEAQVTKTNDPSFGSALYAFNLLRIAFLEQQVGDRIKEIESWEEWKMYTSHTNTHPLPPVDRKAFFNIAQLYNEGTLSLDNYIQMRLKSLETLKNK